MVIGELFAGIGGLGLGLERAIPGARIAWQVEQNPFCRHILEKHWPEARRFEDVRTVTKEQLETVDIIAAGFPCQGASVAGKRLGLSDDRTALWWEVVRIASVLRPRYLVLENVPGLLTVSGGRDFGTVLGSMAQIGYDAEWTCISASEFGAPHIRERLFIIGTTANANSVDFFRRNDPVLSSQKKKTKENREITYSEALRGSEIARRNYWASKSSSPFCGMDDGIPKRVDRLRALGNAVVPQCAEWIGQRIASYQAEQDIPW